ncbi:MAG: hypothetical protein WCW46_00320 [Candidatus Paceibacterota bacterium]
MLSGEKNSTWRLFDDKDLSLNDEFIIQEWGTGENFGKALIIKVEEKKLKDLQDSDFEGHEKYESEEKMYENYRKYYGDKVTPDTVVKMIDFKLN